MAATQSHAFSFKEFPAVRMAWPGQLRLLQQATGGLTQSCFTAVIVGVVEIALETAREQVARRKDALRSYERVEWARAELEGWLIEQAYEGMLRAMEEGRDSRMRSVQAKTAIAEVGPCTNMQDHRRRHPLPLLTFRILVRGRAGARLSAPALGFSV